MRVDISGSWLYIYTHPFDTNLPASQLTRDEYRLKKAIYIPAILSVEVSQQTRQIVLHVQGMSPLTLWSVSQDSFARTLNTVFQALESIGIDRRYL